MRFYGLDAGSVSVKLVILDEDGRKLLGIYQKHKGHPLEAAYGLLREHAPQGEASFSLTGSSGRLIAEVMGIESINEIVAQAFATRTLFPHIKSVIEMGGEDSKLIILGDDGVKDFSMNSVCAAGTGSFLDQQAERLRLTPEAMSELALKCAKPPRIAGRCSVFAKSDMIHLQQIATPVEDIVAGLCFAVARNFRGSIARGREVLAPVSFQGGVAANLGMRRAFKEVFALDDLFVPEDFALMGALGAAMKSRDQGLHQPMRLEMLAEYIERKKSYGAGHPSLRSQDDQFHERHLSESRDKVHSVPPGRKTGVYMGIDIGSISTNVALVDADGRLISKRYLMTAGRPIEAVRQGLREVYEEVGESVEVLGVGTTGSGRYMISDYVGADIVKNEITAQATAAAFIDPSVDTIFEIGGQDSKYISMREGVIVDFEMNKACAAGTGSFLEEQAEKLSISVKDDFAQRAFSSGCPTKLGERCTVFMENSLMANLQKGVDTNDLLAGLAYSIVQNYINRVVAGRHIGQNIFFQGGVAFNKSVVAAFEKFLGRTVTVPPNHDVTGAIGMALIAMRHMLSNGSPESAFHGFAQCQRPYEITSFGCSGCSNMCEINTVKVEEGRKKLFYGGRCEKYDINRKDTSHIPNLFKERDEALFKHVRPPLGGRPVVGIPYIFYFNEFLPYWSVLVQELGFDLMVSPKPDRQIVDLGLQSVISEACYPVKVALGHVRYLRDKGVDAVLNPSFINLNNGVEGMPGLACPHTQSFPYVSNVAIDGVGRMLAPIVDMSRGSDFMFKQIYEAFKPLGSSRRDVAHAMRKAEEAQQGFYDTVKSRGREVLSGIKDKTVIVVGRSYNAMERGMNLQIPEKLATLGVLAIPMDMLPTDGLKSDDIGENMYWRSGQKILRAATYVAGHDLLYPIFIGNFSCGPDSFILKNFKDVMGGKPFLHIEIDEHSADAGAITRCEAFLDSISHRRESKPAGARNGKSVNSLVGRTIYVPRMSDHALALVAAFQRSGIPSEMLPESDAASRDEGMRYTSGKECYPCIVTTGDMMKLATSPGFDTRKAAFFMPSGSGPCRFGQYNVFHKNILEANGLQDVPVLAPNQDDNFYNELGLISGDFALNSWKGIVAIELLYKCVRETRPYEMVSGTTEAVYEDYLRRAFDTLRGAGGPPIEDLLRSARSAFSAVAMDKSERRPLIGVVGEIYVRSNRFSNEDLVRRIEDLGGEVWMSPVEEWIHYVSFMGLRKALIKRNVSGILNTLVKRVAKHRVEHSYSRIFKGFLTRLHEPNIKDVLRQAAPYVDDSFEGEAVLSIGKSVDLARKGACGIVNAMPFGCMPGTIVTALMRAIGRDFGIPCISVPYDGTESQTTRLQLEAFIDQSRALLKARGNRELKTVRR